MRPLILVVLILLLLISPLHPAVLSLAQGSPIKHVVVIMQENRTFDHYFGTYPGANGLPPGTKVPVDPCGLVEVSVCNTSFVEPYHLETRRTPDPPHDERTTRLTYNSGNMDGILYAHSLKRFDGTIAMGYYDHRDIPYYWNLAEYFVLADNFFSSVAGGSFQNHLYLYAGTDDRPQGGEYGSAPPEGMDIPIIFDLLEEEGISWKNYVQSYDPNINYTSEVDRLGLGPKSAQLIWTPPLGIPRYVHDPALNSKIQDLSEYFVDIQSDEFPSVVYISPAGQSEHAPGDIATGQLFVVTLIAALMTSQYWWDTVFILTYDDWGGWYDHVFPPQIDEDGYGPRVPTLIISPYAKEGYIDSTTYDFTSILAFIETVFDLPPLVPGGRDATANNLMQAFDFTAPPRTPVIPRGEYPMKTLAEERSPFIVSAMYGGILSFAVFLPFAVWLLPRWIRTRGSKSTF